MNVPTVTQRLANKDDTKKAKPVVAKGLLPRYEVDGGPLTASQLRQIKKPAPQGDMHSIRISSGPSIAIIESKSDSVKVARP